MREGNTGRAPPSRSVYAREGDVKGSELTEDSCQREMGKGIEEKMMRLYDETVR